MNKKNIKFEYEGDYFWLKRDDTFWIRGRPLGCGYQWIRIVEDDVIEELQIYIELLEEG